MKKLLVGSALILSLLLPPYSLSSTPQQDQKFQQLESLVINDGMYDDHNAFVNEAEYSLEKILESIEIICCDVNYSVEYKDKDGNNVSKNVGYRLIGSGVVIEKKDGKAYIITNFHVTDFQVTDFELPYDGGGVKVKELSRRIYVFKDEGGYRKEVGAKRVAFDKNLDVAVLEVNDSEDFKKFPYKIGNSDDLRPGDFVWIAGNPHGLEDYVLKGNVSKKDYPGWYDWFMIGCDVQPGYSGGAVIAIRDGRYELVGLVVATLVRSGGEQEEMTDPLGGYGLAIKINPIMNFVDDYFNKKKTNEPPGNS